MENQEQPTQLTSDEFNRLIHGLDDFLATHYESACLDDDEDRLRVATGVASWMISDKTTLESPEKLLPKAKYHLGFNVVDEATGEHIVRLTLDRTREMADGDFMQLQNFFWTTIGRAIRDNPSIRSILEAGGVRVETDPSDGGAGGQQFAS
jgi:hypothetical protein